MRRVLWLRDQRAGLIGLGLLVVVTVVLVVAALLRTPTGFVSAVPAPRPAGSAASAGSPAPSSPAAPVAVFLGDRYTEGAQWPDQVGAALGWRVVNLAEAGMGYRVAPKSCEHKPCTPFRGLAQLTAEQGPSVVVLAGGEADGDQPLQQSVDSTLAEFRRVLPDARIVVLPPLSARSPQPYWLMMHAQTLRTAATDAGVTFLDTSAVTGERASYREAVVTPQAGDQLAELMATTVG